MFTFSQARLAFAFDYPQPWVLYFLFAYLENPPTDETFEMFESAADRAADRFADPDAMVQYKIANANSLRQAKRLQKMQARWQWFRKRYGHKRNDELLGVIAFFLNEKTADELAAVG